MGKPLGRPRTPDGRRTAVTVRFSDAEAALIERARGEVERSAWIRAAVVRAAQASEVAAGSAAHNRDMERRDHASRSYAREPGSGPRRCTHAGTRIIGGYCPQCDHVIESGGVWR